MAVDKFFDYTVERQKWPNIGPIPEGAYWIQNFEITSPKMPFSEGAWGKYRVTIHPFIQTVTYGRGGFFIHGGATFGSAGCIDLAYGMDNFVAKLREKLPSESATAIPKPLEGEFPSTGERELQLAAQHRAKHCPIPLTVKYAAKGVPSP